jgi:acylphosphatase
MVAAERGQRRYVVEGRVQGVWFRAETRREALRLGIDGWVRNRSDGSVEVLAQGSPTQLDRLEAWLAEGPPLASVIHVACSEEEPGEVLSGFDIAPTR